MTGKKIGISAAVVLAVGLLSAVLALAGCGGTSQGATDKVEPKQEEKPLAATYQEWIAQYPDEYASFNVDKWEADDKNHSHAYLRTLVEEYNGKLKLNGSCIACKTTSYNTLYDEYGDDLLEMPWEEVEGKVEAYYDCRLCHTDSQTLDLKPSLTYFENLARDTFAADDTKTKVCGQCHNGLAIYRTLVAAPDKSFEDLNPYRYGTDAEAVYKAALEDKCGASLDEATGAMVVRGTGENELETFQGSIHQSMGVTCVDCHMKQTENAAGEAFTNHNASGSPLENEAALEYCLTCHKNQGVESTSAMVDFVKERQDTFAKHQAATEQKIETIKQLLTEATAEGTLDAAVLDEARSKYSQANFFVQFYSGLVKDGAKIVHNPDTATTYLNRADKLLDEGIALLG